MNMQKRGQVTTFIVIGVIIVALVLMILYMRQTLFIPITPERLDLELDPIKKHVEECLVEVSDLPLERIGLQGGYLKTGEDTYRLYNDSRVSYLCFSKEGTLTCYNRLLTKENMQIQLKGEIEEQLKGCLNVKGFGRLRPYDVIVEKDPNVNVLIEDDSVLINADYPITLKSKKGESTSIDKFSVNVNVPLGRLYETAQTIIDVESQFGEFDILSYMYGLKGRIRIHLDKPYPDKVYVMKTEDKGYIFQFAVQGEEREF